MRQWEDEGGEFEILRGCEVGVKGGGLNEGRDGFEMLGVGCMWVEEKVGGCLVEDCGEYFKSG